MPVNGFRPAAFWRCVLTMLTAHYHLNLFVPHGAGSAVVVDPCRWCFIDLAAQRLGQLTRNTALLSHVQQVDIREALSPFAAHVGAAVQQKVDDLFAGGNGRLHVLLFELFRRHLAKLCSEAGVDIFRQVVFVVTGADIRRAPLASTLLCARPNFMRV
ncbi:hypothetical protein D9M71_702730 [compost metagenome]